MVEEREPLWDIEFKYSLKGRDRSLRVEAWDIHGTGHGSHMWLWEDGKLFHPGGRSYDPPFLED